MSAEAVRMEAHVERALRCGSALERGDGAALEPLAQLGDAFGGVGALAAERVVAQAESKGGGGVGASAEPDKRAGATRGAAAHSSEVTALPLSLAHSSVMPSVV